MFEKNKKDTSTTLAYKNGYATVTRDIDTRNANTGKKFCAYTF